MKPHVGLIAFVAALLAAGCGAASNPESSAARDESLGGAAVLAASESHVNAWRQNDASAIAGHVANDVVISSPEQPDIRGRDAAERTWRDMLLTAKVMQLDVRPEPIMVSDDLAVEAGEYDELVQVTGQPELLEIKGRYVCVWQRQTDDTWKIIRFIATDRPDAAEAPL